MTEFAYSGLGLNKHFGTPLSPIGRDEGMIAGGSTSGGAVSVAENMSLFAVGSDTSGSCRIPAACCGLVGFRPSQKQYSNAGIIPLAHSFDVPGLIANSVECIAAITRAVSPDSETVTEISTAKDLNGMHFLVPEELASLEADATVSSYFDCLLDRLRQLGAKLNFRPFLFEQIATRAMPSDIVAFEAFQFHKPYISRYRSEYDPRIAMRMDAAASLLPAYYNVLIEQLGLLRQSADQIIAEFDAILTPTLPILPPTLLNLDDVAEYIRFNSLIIRNTGIANHLDLPAICLPVTESVTTHEPVSIQLIGRRGADRALLDMASIVSKFI